jgi:hypothetical protein
MNRQDNFLKTVRYINGAAFKGQSYAAHMDIRTTIIKGSTYVQIGTVSKEICDNQRQKTFARGKESR